VDFRVDEKCGGFIVREVGEVKFGGEDSFVWVVVVVAVVGVVVEIVGAWIMFNSAVGFM
jgi:hypothetical protein